MSLTKPNQPVVVQIHDHDTDEEHTPVTEKSEHAASSTGPIHIDRPGRHFDNMMGQTRAHHVQLSVMADQKAGMLMTLCTIGIPLTLKYLEDPTLAIPAIVLISCNLLTVFFAALTIMPKLTPMKRANTSARLFNPLFFGDFAKLTYDEYLESMQRVFNGHEQAYEAQMREVYAMGQYLAKKKYFYLKCAFITFLTGVFASALVWLIIQSLHVARGA
ncbi:MAG: hypothetical protein GC164_08045 [Phycisphaera sp.]|nr:hypothetical protein [Phycisphaera sp.]